MHDKLTAIRYSSLSAEWTAKRCRARTPSYEKENEQARNVERMEGFRETVREGVPSELREWAKPTPQTDYAAMRHSYAKSYGEMEDKQIPSKEYLEKKLHELENGEFRAEALTEVVSRDDVDPDTLMPVWDAKGHITVKRGNTTVAMPAGPEQLRMRLAAMATALIMMRMKHTAFK